MMKSAASHQSNADKEDAVFDDLKKQTLSLACSIDLERSVRCIDTYKGKLWCLFPNMIAIYEHQEKPKSGSAKSSCKNLYNAKQFRNPSRVFSSDCCRSSSKRDLSDVI